MDCKYFLNLFQKLKSTLGLVRKEQSWINRKYKLLKLTSYFSYSIEWLIIFWTEPLKGKKTKLIKQNKIYN